MYKQHFTALLYAKLYEKTTLSIILDITTSHINIQEISTTARAFAYFMLDHISLCIIQ